MVVETSRSERRAIKEFIDVQNDPDPLPQRDLMRLKYALHNVTMARQLANELLCFDVMMERLGQHVA